MVLGRTFGPARAEVKKKLFSMSAEREKAKCEGGGRFYRGPCHFQNTHIACLDGKEGSGAVAAVCRVAPTSALDSCTAKLFCCAGIDLVSFALELAKRKCCTKRRENTRGAQHVRGIDRIEARGGAPTALSARCHVGEATQLCFVNLDVFMMILSNHRRRDQQSSSKLATLQA